nr:reverse transcriptase domain-containing protein [Tanacetum cinerariifolium]
MRRVRKGFSGVETPLFEENDKAAQKLEIIKLKARVKRLEKANKGRMIDDLDKDEGIKLTEIYHLDLDHSSKVLSMQEDDSEVQKVVKVVTTGKLITDVVTAVSQVSAASATISAAKPSIPAAAPTVVAAYTRRRKGVIIRDQEEELSSKTPVETPKLKDKGKGILIETPKPIKKKDQIELAAEYARKFHEEINQDHEEINKDIDWDAAIDHNTAGYKMDFFKGMSYDEICPIFQARFDANMRFLFMSREEMEEEDQEVLKSINETSVQKAAKRRKLSEEAQEAEDLKKRLEVVDDEDDDVFIKATPLARKTMFEKPDGQDAVWKSQRSVLGLALRSWKNTKCVNVANEELTAAKHKLMIAKDLLSKGLPQMVLQLWFRTKASTSYSNCTLACQVKYAACTMQGVALTWWNSHVKTVTLEFAQALPLKTLKKMMTDKYCPRGEIKKLVTNMWELKTKGTDVIGYSRRFQELALMCDRMFLEKSDRVEKKIRSFTECQTENKRKQDDNKNQAQQQPLKKQGVAVAYTARPGERKEYAGTLPLCNKCKFHHNGQCTIKCVNCKRVCHLTRDCRSPAATNNHRNPTCYQTRNQGHYRSDCPELKNQDHVNQARDYEEINGGYVAFGGNPKGGKITGKGKFDGKADEEFFVKYSLSNKAFRVFNSRKRIVEENLHIMFSENTPNVVGSRLDWLFDIDALIRTMIYEPIAIGTQSNGFADTKACDNTDDGFQPSSDSGKKVDEDPSKGSKCRDQEQDDNVNSTNNVNATSTNRVITFNFSSDQETDMNNMDTTIQGKPVPTTRIHKDHPLDQVIRDLHSTTQTRNIWMSKVFFSIGKIEEEVYVCQPPGFEDQDFPKKVYKVEKALYGLHQAPRAWYKTFSIYLLNNGFKKGKINKTLFIKRHKGLQVKQKNDGIFICQDKYVAKILKKFGFTEVKNASAPIETQKPPLNDEDGEEVNVHLYSSGLLIRQNPSLEKHRYMPSTVASAIICLATNQKFNFSKWIFESTGRNLDNESGKFLMYLRNPRRKVTEVPQPSDPIEHDTDEAVYKELDDRLVRATTTASSLEAEHDSDFNKDASKQGRKIHDIDADEDITLVNDQHNEQMFDVNDLQGEEVFVQEDFANKEVNAAGEVNAASIATSNSAAITMTVDEVTLAQALITELVEESSKKAEAKVMEGRSKRAGTELE